MKKWVKYVFILLFYQQLSPNKDLKPQDFDQ